MERLHDLMDQHALVGDVRGRGLLLGLDLVADRDSRRPAHDAAEAVLYRAMELGLSFKVTMGHVLTLTPPLTISEPQMDAALDIIDRCLGEVAAGGPLL